MTTTKPTSFRIFSAVISITVFVFLTATVFSFYRVDTKYAMILAFLMFVALSFTTVGIYTGFTYRTDDDKAKMFNRIGLIGNLIICLFTIGLMAFAAMTTAS